jgi:hypothetical protein
MAPQQDGSERPVRRMLTACGRKAWQEFTEAHAADLNREDFPPHLRGAWSKFRGCCGRLALITQQLRVACGETGSTDVDGESVERAVVLIDYFKGHARRVHGVMAADREAEAARRILKWIRRKKVKEEKFKDFCRWEVHKDLASRTWFPRMEDLDQPLERLVRHHYIRPKALARGNTGRPGGPAFEVNSAFLSESRENRENREKPGPGEGGG